MVEKSSKGHYARIIADSVSPEGVRLTTFEVRYWRAILAEMNTHRMFSRNTASSRAKPVSVLYQEVAEDPFTPVYWGLNQSGMSARQELTTKAKEKAIQSWLIGRDKALEVVQTLSDIEVHKQIANRVLEPWMWTTQIISSTNYSNFFALRCHTDAQPEIQHIANLMRNAYFESIPIPKYWGDWHLPYLQKNEVHLDPLIQRKISVARCARVSYKNFTGLVNIDKDLELYERLCSQVPLHASPAEHVAKASQYPAPSNFTGWEQLRKTLPNECVWNFEGENC